MASIASIGACSLFGFDDFSGGDDTNDGGAGDASSDATLQDGAPNTDGDVDADAGPSGPFCKTVGADAALCDDFEEPGTFTGKWSEEDHYLGTIEVKDAIGFNGSRGLSFNATPTNAPIGGNARVVLGWQTPSIASYIDTELAVKLEEMPPTGYVAGPLHVQIDDLNGGYARFAFALDSARVVSTNPVLFPADAGAISNGQKAITTLDVGVWTRIRLVVDLAKSPPVLYAYANGSLKNEQTINEGFKPEKITVRIGAQYAGTQDGGTIRMVLDDARVSWK